MTEKIQIILNSKTANQYLNGNTTDCLFIIPAISIKKQHRAYISLIDAIIPYSFYNLNFTNDKLNYIVNGIEYNIIIDHANYNVNTLILYLLNNMISGFSIIYDNTKNKLTFYHSTYDFILLSSSTVFELLGFEDNINYSSINLQLLSNIGVNFFTIRNILISSSNFILNNINSSTPNKASIISAIPISSAMGSIIHYKNINNISSLVHEVTNITNLHIQLLDQDGDLMNLNGLHFSINLLLIIE